MPALVDPATGRESRQVGKSKLQYACRACAPSHGHLFQIAHLSPKLQDLSLSVTCLDFENRHLARKPLEPESARNVP